MKLRHIPLKGLTHYQHAARLQGFLVRQFLAAKADSKLSRMLLQRLSCADSLTDLRPQHHLPRS